MSVNVQKSTFIQNRDASPARFTDSEIGRGLVRKSYGYVTANGVTPDSAGSTYIMQTVPSNARVSAVFLSCAALGLGAAVNVGVYENEANGGLEIDQSFFADALDVSGALGPTNITEQSGEYTQDLQEMPLWQALGLSVDPSTTLDIVVTVSGAIAASGLLGLTTEWTE